MNLIPTTYAYELKDQFAFGSDTFNGSLGQIISQLIKPIFAFSGIIVVVFFAIAAFNIITSGGEKDKISSARNMMTYAIIGFTLMILTFVIVQVVPVVLGLKGFKII